MPWAAHIIYVIPSKCKLELCK